MVFIELKMGVEKMKFRDYTIDFVDFVLALVITILIVTILFLFSI